MARTRKQPAPPQPCGCPAEVNGLEGVHRPGCPYLAAAVETGVTTDRRAKEQAPAPSSSDFDESTPPPRARPRGVPIRPHLVLPPGEPAIENSLVWDREGRVPERSVLCEFVGTGNRCGVSGYVILAHPAGNSGPLVPVRSAVKPAAIEPYRVVSTIRVQGDPKTYCVLAPAEGRG